MNREIKFRAWDKRTKQFMKTDHFGLLLNGNYIARSEYNEVGGQYAYTENDLEIEIMQFTGLKDKNGKEIYEGDIIVKQMSDRPYSERKKYEDVVMVVEWYKGTNESTANSEFNKRNLDKDPSCYNQQPCFRGKRIKGEFCCHNWSEFAGCEVIGNIYKTPELLSTPPTEE